MHDTPQSRIPRFALGPFWVGSRFVVGRSWVRSGFVLDEKTPEPADSWRFETRKNISVENAGMSTSRIVTVTVIPLSCISTERDEYIAACPAFADASACTTNVFQAACHVN